jgi:SAM-dependent methyltransferase
VLNKIKKLFMKKEEYQTLEEANGEAIRKDFEELENQNEKVDTANLTEIQPTAKELSEIKNQGYLEDSATVVGYATRQDQYAAYDEIKNIIPASASVLDFGCGRGDFFAWHEITYGKNSIDYLGIDANQTLIDTGNKLYDNVNLICDDWNSLNQEQARDWCINIRSNNLRYDSQIEMADDEYVKQTIDKMFEVCNEGLVISLSSDKFDITGQLKYSAGEIMNWALSKYDMVAVDHTTNTNQFLVIIYKKY